MRQQYHSIEHSICWHLGPSSHVAHRRAASAPVCCGAWSSAVVLCLELQGLLGRVTRPLRQTHEQRYSRAFGDSVVGAAMDMWCLLTVCRKAPRSALAAAGRACRAASPLAVRRPTWRAQPIGRVGCVRFHRALGGPVCRAAPVANIRCHWWSRPRGRSWMGSCLADGVPRPSCASATHVEQRKLLVVPW